MSMEILPDKKTGIPRLIAATGYSWQGLRHAVRYEEAVRLEVIAFFFLLPLALYLGEDAIERVLLVGVLVLVIIVELFNTAIEAIVDRIGVEYHELAGLAKDLGSACVLISLCLTVFVWGMLLLQ